MNNSIDRFASLADYSFIKQLKPDPDTAKYQPNKSSREVKSGHYVEVKPTPLPRPRLVCLSRILLEELGLHENDCKNDQRFLRFFSGDTDVLRDKGFNHSWATPYALSIYGTDYTANCPFGTGNGYGDGRAISVAEVVIPETNKRWEFQLKGAGKTPFCRGGDGRAVLRSSVREFLASEAMHHLGISTTRAISLIMSEEEKVKRPWYSESKRHMPDLDLDTNLPPHFAQMLRAQFFANSTEPDVMVSNPAAITCRVAASFIRVGQVQLFERRARRDPGRLQELRAIVDHLLFREFPHLHSDQSLSFEDKAIQMLREASQNIAQLTADWVRVGFCQGNFNSDNCLAAGRTMDYGPFGFLERFRPLWNMWSGGGEHFGFLNQPTAGYKNFSCLCKAVDPLFSMSKDPKIAALASQVKAIAAEHEQVSDQALDKVWAQKLGFSRPLPPNSKLVPSLFALLETTEADYIMFFRQLALVVERSLFKQDEQANKDRKLEKAEEENDEEDWRDKQLILPLGQCYYSPVGCKSQAHMVGWVRQWLELLEVDARQTQRTPAQISASMRLVSPKYVPREWILVKAYTAANNSDYNLMQELYDVFTHPYDEQPDMEEKYYRKAPEEVYRGGGKGGTAYMS